MTTQYIYDLVDTWNDGATTFTAIKMNVTDTASNAASNLMDLQVATASKFSVTKTGVINVSGNIVSSPASINIEANSLTARFGDWNVNATGIGVDNPGLFYFTSSVSNAGFFSADTMLTRRAAANFRFGAADVGATSATVTITIAAPGVVTWSYHGLSTGTPVVFTTTGALPTGITSGTTYYVVAVNDTTFQLATSVANAIAATPTVITTSGSQSGTHFGTRYNITQRLSMQSITGVTDRFGADLFIQGSQGTGTGAGGSIIFQVAPAGGTGTAQNALATALTINSARQAEFSGDLQVVSGRGGIANGSGPWVASNAKLAFGGNFAGPFLQYDGTENTLALRNGTAAQTFRVYNTYDGTNDERGFIKWSSNVLQIGTDKTGTGTARALEFQTNGTTRLTIEATSGSVKFGSNATVDTAGNLTLGGFAAVTGIAYYRSDMQIRNKADSSWLTFATRDTTGAEAVYNLTNVGTVESVSIKTAAPSGGTSGTWKLGVRVAATTTLDITQYIQVDVGGTLYKLAVVTS